MLFDITKTNSKKFIKKIKSKGIETSKCVLNKLLKINIEIKKMKEEICLLFFFPQFSLKDKIGFDVFVSFPMDISLWFFLLLLLLLLYSGLLSHVIGIFKSFSFIVFLFFFSPLVPFDIANSTQLLQYSFGYNEKKRNTPRSLTTT